MEFIKSGTVLALVLLVVLTYSNKTSADVDETLDGLSVGITDQGHPFKGSPDAPITIIEYSDYLCPFCARFFNSSLPELTEKYLLSGKLKMEFRHYPIAKLHPGADSGHQAASCVAEHGAIAFWRYHDALFKRQSEWNRLPDPDDFLLTLAVDQDIDEALYRECRESGRQAVTVQRSVENAQDLGFRGTPSFQIFAANKPDQVHTVTGSRPGDFFAAYIDALLAGKEPPAEPEKPEPKLPDWATTEALAVDDQRPGYTVSGDPWRGDAEARLVIVEFTDYQCPACARHLQETQPEIDKQLISSGKVRWVYKMLPLREHRNAPAAAVAAECAGDQNRFHDMHKALFDKQDSWAEQEPPDSALLKIAVELDLDAQRFSSCLGSRQALERVMSDLYDASDIARSTPLFVILDGKRGQTIRGRQSPERFITAVENYLESVLKRDAVSVKADVKDENGA